jgi:repressor LexA
MARKGPSRPQPLTPNEKKVLEFIELYISSRGLSPSYQEMKNHFGFASFNSIQRYLKQLENKGYLYMPGENKKRALTLLHSSGALQSSLPTNRNLATSPGIGSGSISRFSESGTSLPSESLSLPLLGRVAAGLPIEELEDNETFDVPASLVRNPNKTFALRVKGQSMIDDGIFDGDVILVQRQEHASNGEIVVAVVENEATVKRLYAHTDKNEVELRPANSTMSSLWYHPQLVKIQGVLVGLIRRF